LEFCSKTPRYAAELHYLERSVHSDDLADCVLQFKAVLQVLVRNMGKISAFSCCVGGIIVNVFISKYCSTVVSIIVTAGILRSALWLGSFSVCVLTRYVLKTCVTVCNVR